MPTTKEHFQKVFHYEEFDRPPDFEFGYWEETLEKWINQEKIPQNILQNNDDKNFQEKAEKYFGFERLQTLPIAVDLKPRFERKVVEEDERTRIVRNERGITCRELKNHETCQNGLISLSKIIRISKKWRKDTILPILKDTRTTGRNLLKNTPEEITPWAYSAVACTAG
ncbi:hypothetical protein AKJ57_03825 [candidate division MSBL1 archaeon SCGC-AAA259A05]|uniref:Uncharacterized protein n=1 Tax=candidate division MSBL1 archaeon SCGC-AAA259A05 TaxID=1698259 RepID=A0A133U999_9EURY|nr:hypothetical protein AKJ57_03825 [candidate division MSBL1 archaeon SCGC-AAA259A05]